MAGTTRRGVLASVAAGAAALAGCSTGGGGGSDGGDGAHLHRLDVINRREEAVTVDVQVEFDGSPVFWQRYDLDARGGTERASVQVEQSWPDEAGEFVVEARIAGDGEIRTTTYERGACLDVLVNVNDDGVGFFSGEAERCGSTTTQA